ncbi:MAG TPA: hypothetical protein VEV16_13000 [Daejeonella sp.]|nr:hypothetical protein [Daejeonella sp.]
MNFRRLMGIIGCLSLLLAGNSVYGQTETEPVIEQLIEQLAEEMDEDFDFSELSERLNFYYRNPVNVNKISREQLQELFFLSPLQIDAFLQHRHETGDLLDLLELQSIEGFDLTTIYRFLNFVFLGPENSLANVTAANLLSKGRHDLIFRYGQILQVQKGFQIPDSSDRSRYLGSPDRLLLRYRYYYGRNISASLNMRKDAGEQFLWGSKPAGFDFYSANMMLRNLGFLKKLAIGDYTLQFGQGLTLWSGLTFGKGPLITSLAKPDWGLGPHHSVNKSQFLRGISASADLGKFTFTPFLSYKKIDASLVQSDNGDMLISSIGQSGLHRTPTELKNKNASSQFIYGSNIQYRHRQLNLGITAYHTQFGHPLEASNLLYNRFKFAGQSLSNAGFHYSYSYQNTYWFGEIAYQLQNGMALMNGLMSSLSPKVSMILLHRHYQKNYYSVFNQAISEASNAVNEQGFYSGLQLKLNSHWELITYADFFRFRRLNYRIDAPSMGYEWFSQFNYSLNKKLRVSGYYKMKVKAENESVGYPLNILQEVKRQNYRLELNYQVHKNIVLRNRLEICQHQKGDHPDEYGYLAYQDVIYHPLQTKISGNLRFAIFDTRGFNSRIYTYENDVLYSYSVPAFQYSGLRFYVNGRYSLSRGLDVWARYAVTSYTNQQTIGSGLDQIDGNRRSEVKLQVRYQF